VKIPVASPRGKLLARPDYSALGLFLPPMACRAASTPFIVGNIKKQTGARDLTSAPSVQLVGEPLGNHQRNVIGRWGISCKILQLLTNSRDDRLRALIPQSGKNLR
jgi:hypothetical protein